MVKWLAVSGIVLIAAQASAGETPVLKTDLEKASYAVGVEFARNVKRQGVALDPDLLAMGLKDGLSGGKVLLTDDGVNKGMAIFRSAVKRKQTESRRGEAQARTTAAPDNKRIGQAFLAENAKKAGVVTLPSGLQYKVLKAGDGRKPADADTVECRYRGTLVDGTEFDRTDPAGKPATFKVAQVIPGWREALKLMPAGSRWQLFVPPGLAYGDRGSGPIGPNETLIFEVELLAVK